MLSWLRQTCGHFFSLVSRLIYQILILSSSAIQLYLRIYYPLVYLEELASSHLNHDTTLYGTALALLTVVLATYRSLELFFPSIRMWPMREEQDSRVNDAEQFESEATGEAFEALDAIDLSYGLTNAEVSTRLSKYGKNVLWTGRNFLLTILRTVLTVGNLLPEVAMLAAAFCGEWMIAFALIPPLVISNGVDLYQMKQADDVKESISWSARLRAVVLREGGVLEIDAADLVPGDVVHISKGQTVPADVRVIRISSPLSCDQSVITGEPAGISKERGDMCYVSTGVVSGSAFCVVVDTGSRTFIGRTARLVSGVKSGGPDDRDLNDYVASVGRILWTTIVVTVVMLWSTGTSRTDILRIIVSCTMLTYYANGRGTAISMRAKMAAEMSEQGAIMQSVQDLETLAAVDVLLTDTTGTITENRLMVLEPFCLDCDVEDLILTACLCQRWQESDPITKAVLDSLRHYAQARDRLVRYKVIDYEPFDPTTKRMWALVESPEGEQVTCILGAPRSCLNVWQEEHSDDPNNRHLGDRFKDAAASLATRGARTLGVLRKRENSKLELLGLLPLADGSRWDARSAVREAQSLGVKVKLLTGHATVIGENIAQSIGLCGNALTMGSSQDKNEEDDNHILSIQDAEAADCFCEVFPEHKIEIVRTLQKSGHTVAVTGDGLSDVPALHYADFGIAVEGSSEKAQSAAQLVMLKSGIASLVAAITAARRHFRLLQTFFIHRASGCVDLIAMCWLWYWKFRTPLHPEYLYLIICFDDLIQYSFSRHKDDGGTALEMLPARLSIHNAFRNGLWMNTVAIALKVFVLQYISSDDPGSARWALYLVTIVWSNLTFFLLYGRGHFSSPSILRSNLLKVLRSTLAAMIPLVFSWAVYERPMDFMTASGQRLATASLASTLCQCWLMREIFTNE